jgi:predicted RNA binding protein YcfA (HicA-like mRNA interferase family)
MKLPVISGSEAVKAFRKVRYEFDDQHGSHMILQRADPPHRCLSVPNHKELAKGTLRTLIREAGLTVEEFARLLQLSPDDRRRVNSQASSNLAFEFWRRPTCCSHEAENGKRVAP